MTSHTEPSDHWDDDHDLDEGIDQGDWRDDDDADRTMPCPYCQRDIYDDAERCPYCERYVSREDAPFIQKPLWIVVGVLAGLFVVYRWVTFGGF